MSAFNIKIIAILAMVVDHIGLFFFPNIIEFRIIGRLSFPLFAWLIANGAYYTHDINKYLQRIIIFALISQLPFTLVICKYTCLFYPNVLFTLSLGLVAIKVIKETKNKLVWLVVVLVCALLATIFNMDYGAVGVLSIVSFYLFFKNISLMFLAQMILLLVFPTILIILLPYFHLIRHPLVIYYFNALGIFSLFFISSYNNQEGAKTKYLFYLFFPLQYAALFLLKLLF